MTTKMKRCVVGTFPAYEVTIDIVSSVEDYALSFLAIFNNVKTSKELIRITNDYGSKVSVVCVEDALESAKAFLSQFGKIVNVDKVLCASIEDDIEYDFDVYEDLVIVPYQD